MKTLQEIEKLITDDRNEAADIQTKFSHLDEDQKKNALKRIKKLKQNISYHEEIKKYLLSSHSKEWLEKEEERLRNRLQKIAEGYKAWSDQNKRPFDKEAAKLSFFNKENGVHDLKRWLRNTMFILN